MNWLFTWGGRCFGFHEGNDLWTQDGRHIGRFVGDEVYGADGRYLGELMGEDRLITNLMKKSKMRAGFSPHAGRIGRVKQVDYVGNVMLTGYEDFPNCEK